jgi:hypothetical protein
MAHGLLLLQHARSFDIQDNSFVDGVYFRGLGGVQVDDVGLARQGQLEKIAPGLYTSPAFSPSEHASLVEASYQQPTEGDACWLRPQQMIVSNKSRELLWSMTPKCKEPTAPVSLVGC